MKRIILLLMLILLMVSISSFGQVIERIPRRVVFSQTGGLDIQDPDRKALSQGFIDYLYTSIAKLQPILRVEDPALAHSSIHVAVRPGNGSILIEVVLQEDGQTKASKEYLWAQDDKSLEGYTAFIEETAEAFAPYLDLVIPEVEAVDFSQAKKLVEVKEEMDYADLLNKRWELTLWLGGINRVFHDPVRDDPETLQTRVSVLPIYFDAAYYFTRNFGLYASLFFDYGDFFAFGVVREMDETVDKARSENLFLLPGVGISYRTLGLISAQFNLGFYYGAVRITPINDVEGVGASGETVWLGYSSLAISTALAWNFTPVFSLKTKMGINLNLVGLFQGEAAPYEFGYNGFFLTFFSIGPSVRF